MVGVRERCSFKDSNWTDLRNSIHNNRLKCNLLDLLFLCLCHSEVLVSRKSTSLQVHHHFAEQIPQCPPINLSPSLLGKKRFFEGQTQTYIMKHVKPKTFKLFTRWVYSGLLALDVQYEETANGPAFTSKNELCNMGFFTKQTRSVLRLWVLGQELLIPQLQNLVMHYLVTLTGEPAITLSSEASFVYANTSSPCPLRQLLVKLAAWCVPTLLHEHLSRKYPPEFIMDVMLALHQAVPLSASRNHCNALCAEKFLVDEH